MVKEGISTIVVSIFANQALLEVGPGDEASYELRLELESWQQESR